jgi:phage-related minor tail protein
MGATVEATLRGDFASIGRLWSNLLTKMAAEAIAADLFNSLFGNVLRANAGGAGGAGGGGLFASIVSSLFGKFPGRAGGGTVSAGGAYVVGERGPELLRMGSGSGSITPNHAMAGGRGIALSMPTTINIDARSDQAQIAQLVAGAMAETQRNMMATLRARGAL